MVYKRYIKRNGKTFGPYYYESYRDEKGKTRTKLVSVPKKRDKISFKLIYIIIIFSLFLTAGIVLLNSEKTPNLNSSLIKDAPAKISLANSKIIGNIIRLIGFQVSQGDDTAVPSEDEPESAENEEIESLPDEEIKKQQEIAEEPVENSPRDDSGEPNISETNQTKTNETETDIQISPESVKAKTGNFSINSSGSRITAQENISSISQNFSEFNQTIRGESPRDDSAEPNFTINENILQYSAKLGQPVKWKKTLKIDAGENRTINSLEITLPKTAGEVSVKRIFANESVEELEVNIKNEKIVEEVKPIISITGQVVKNGKKISIFKKFFRFFRNFFTLVGRVIDVSETGEEVLVNIQEELEDEDEIEIEYYTEAPYSEEIIFNDNHKEINIVGSEEVHYENILAFSSLSKEVLSKDEINLYWLVNNSKTLVDFTAFDLDENGAIDEIEWIVPSLSNQTYEIILITKAQHLDSNRTFISDIYEQVKALDGNWSEQINDSEYVRITFEKNLTNENDITIYPRIVNGTYPEGHKPRIEVYEFNKTELIAEFTNIIDNEYNKVYLTNLVGEQNVFDLKILGGSVEFDYIVDPFTGPSSGVWMNLSGNDTGDWVGTDTINGVAVNPNNNLVYTGLASGKFGVYNHSNGVWMNLSGNDTGDWAGTDTINEVAVNTNDNLVYTVLDSGKFGVYNHSNGVWMDLSANDTGNWAGADIVKGVAVNTNNNLIYTVLDSGKFGVYNHSNGVWMDLSANDTGDWAGVVPNNVLSVAVNTNNNLVYTGHRSGRFGAYNHSNGVWMDLSANDTGNWAGTGNLGDVAVNTNDNLVYTGLTSGKFGVYNHSNGVWMDLSGNDTGDWAGTDTIKGVAVNTNDNLVYTGLSTGKFGVYRVDLFSGGGAGTLVNPYEITDCLLLQNMSLNLNANYKLMNNIDCSDTINWNGGAGFHPVGENKVNGAGVFTGSLQGNDYNITNLYIKITGASINGDCTGGGGNCTGMFGRTINATINKVHLWNVYVESNAMVVGGLVGAFDDNGTIANSSVHGNVTSKSGSTSYTGGLSGWIWANGGGRPTIYNSSFTGNLSAKGGSVGTGGLVGWSDGIINYSFADVKLNITGNNDVGGLVGIIAVDGGDTGVIDNSYSTGNVSVAGASIRIGGLVGDNNGNIYHSYSTVNVSGRDNVGGLTGENAGIILNSYSCGNVDSSGDDSGGSIGFATSAGKTNYTYSAGVVKGATTVGGFVGQDGTGAVQSYYNFSFYDYEIDGGNYNDTGDRGNVSGIYANTTAQMKKQSTYTALGWDFTNIWQIAEDYSYPYFKWQKTPACGIPVPSVTPIGGGSGNSVDIIILSMSFNVAPKTISVVLKPGETKTECFTVTSTGTLSLTANLNTIGEIIPFTTLTNSVLSIPVQNSKSACAIFSAKQDDVPKNYTGQIKVGAKEKKDINVFLEIRDINATTNITIGILPVGILDIFGKIGFDGILPLGESFLPPGYSGILPVGTFPIGILPVEQSLPLISKKVVKGAVVISLWILLLLLLIIYLAIRRYLALKDQLLGYKSREEKLAVIERLKRNELRKDVNFFEKIIDNGAIYLTAKALEPKSKELSAKTEQKILPVILKKLDNSPMEKLSKRDELYNLGIDLYDKKYYKEALKEFEKSVEIDNKFWQGYQGIGSCYVLMGYVKTAISVFEKSLLINPNNKELVEWVKKYRMRK